MAELASSTTDSSACQLRNRYGPEPALLVCGHAAPRSPSCSWASTSSQSTTDPIPAESVCSTRLEENSSTTVMRTWRSSVTSTRPPTLSALQPSWVRMNTGDPLSRTARSRENSTSWDAPDCRSGTRSVPCGSAGLWLAVVAHGMALGNAAGQRAVPARTHDTCRARIARVPETTQGVETVTDAPDVSRFTACRPSMPCLNHPRRTQDTSLFAQYQTGAGFDKASRDIGAGGSRAA